MKNTLEGRILLFSLLLLTIAIGVNTGFHILFSRQDQLDSLLVRSRSEAAALRRAFEGRGASGDNPHEFTDLAEKCRELAAADPQISHCLFEDLLGRPLFSSDPSLRFDRGVEILHRVAPDAVLVQHPRLGRIYDITVPVLLGGDPIGRFRIGFSEDVLDALAKRMFYRSMGVLGCAFLIFLPVIVVLLKRHLIVPVRRLRSVAQQIAEGQFDVTVPASSTRELTDLATALQEMALSLKMRDEAIVDGYRELEEANLLLQRAYEEQERTSAELRRSQAMYLTLFENASDAIVISDHNDRIILFNRQAEQFFGLPREQVIEKNLFRSVSLVGGDLRIQYDAYRELLDRGNYESELEYVRPSDGCTVVGWVRAAVARDRDGKNWVQAIVRDVTREREIKENLEKSARELDRLNQMKNSFLGLASHELKTPLTAIVGYADLILTDMAPTTDEAVLSMVRHIAEGADRLTGIVRDMVDVSMLDGRDLPLNLKIADPNEVVRMAIAEYRPFLSLRRQNLHLSLSDHLSPVSCDPNRLAQAIGNLVGNAIKFTPDEGVITVETRQPDTQDMVEIRIRDTGIGISESDRVHIFEKFYEAGNIEEHFTGRYAFKGKGTGLGLTLAKGIIEMHGGRIWAESPGYDPELFPGSSFHILLPVAGHVPAPFSLADQREVRV